MIAGCYLQKYRDDFYLMYNISNEMFTRFQKPLIYFNGIFHFNEIILS